MSSRLELQRILEQILGSKHVYFQPPSNVRMVYPCIVYERSGFDTRYAGNDLYISTTRYTVTVIDKDPDSPTPGKISKLPLCSFDRHFVADNLNHDIFTLYF